MKSVIINCDPGIDDALAIMLAVQSKSLNIVGITTTFGNVAVNQVTSNALGIIDYLGADIPVAEGSSNPLKGKRINSEYVHGKNGLANIELQHHSKPSEKDAVDFIIDNVESGKADTIINTGPLTNLFSAFKKSPETMHKLKLLIMMGGAIVEPGSITRVAEFNFFCDPYAADFILHTPVRKTMIPRDVTQHTLLLPGDLSRFSKSKSAELAVKLIEFYQKFYINDLGMLGNPLPDALTVGYAIKPELFQMREMDIVVETEGTQTYGMSVAERRGGVHERKAVPNVNVALKTKSKDFIDYFIKTLSL